MMRRYGRGAWILLLMLLLGACAVKNISHRQLSDLDKGLTPSQSINRLKLEPSSIKQVALKGRDYEFHRYILSSGMYFEEYYLAFEQGKLVYWGYVTEFRRLQNADLNEALTQALAIKP